MSDIEGGQPPERQSDRPSSDNSSSSSRSSWLGSILPHRARGGPGSGPGPHPRALTQFSTVQEETSAHMRPSYTSNRSAAGSVESISAPAGTSLTAAAAPAPAPRRSTLDRPAEGLRQLYGTSSSSARDGGSSPSPLQNNSREPGSIRASSGGSGGTGGTGVKPLPSKAASAPQINAMGEVISRMSMQVRVSEHAQKKYIHMVSEEEVAAQVQSSRSMFDRGCVLHPLDRRYRIWWYITVAAAALTGVVVTYRLAFVSPGYHHLGSDGASTLEVILLSVFCMDILISFFVGYYNEQGLLVMNHWDVALHYLRHRFLLDLLTTLPWDWMVLTATGVEPHTTTGRYIALLSLFKLGRMYRMFVMFYNISYNLSVGLLPLTLMRNFTFCFFLLHWAACGFWFVALQEGGSANSRTWVAQELQLLDGSSTIELYIFSFYWALVTFATLGYGDVTPNTTAEVLYTIIYVAINIVAWAYVLGTITLLVTRQDEELGVYRQRMQALDAYCKANTLPHELKQTMAGLLRLHMSLQNEAQGDEQVLGIFPTTIRRKILRQLYSNPLKSCYLFHNTGVKFLDALMLGARVELFLPKVEIVSALDHANELYIVVGGFVEVLDPSLLGQAADTSADGQDKKGLPLQGSLLSTDAENAFTAGMLTAQQVQHAATLGQALPPGSHPSYSRLGPVHEGRQQQHHDAVDGLQHQQQQHPGPPRRLFSGPAALGASSAAAAAASGSADKGSRLEKLLRRLPAGEKLADWVGNTRQDSWRRQQEQLQRDKYDMNQIPVKALARASRSLSTVTPPGSGKQQQFSNDTLKMPAFAMRNLTTTSKVPGLQKSSGGSSSKGVGTTSTGGLSDRDQVAAPPPAAPAGRTELGPGDCFAEVAYFTEVPKAEAVRSLTVCRVLVIPRSTYNAVARDFPLSARQVLENLKRRAQELVEEFLPRDLARELLKDADANDAGGPSRPATAATGGSSGSSSGFEGSHQPQQNGSSIGAVQTAGTAEDGGASDQLHKLSPFSATDAQMAGAARAAADRILQQQHSGGRAQQAASPLEHAGTAPSGLSSAAVTAAALRRLTPAAIAAAAAARSSSTGGGSRRERPVLSSMSVNLSGRHSAAGVPTSPTAAEAAGLGSRRQSLDQQVGRIHSRSTEAASPYRRSEDGAVGSSLLSTRSHLEQQQQQQQQQETPDEASARALARFNVQVNPRHRGALSAGSDAELLARVGASSGGAGAGAGMLGRSSTLSPTALPRQQPLSPRQHSQRGDEDAQRMLRTLSLLPQRNSNAEMARAWEGLPQQQRQQEQQGQRDSSAGGQKQLPPVAVKLAGLGYEEGSRIYSDEEVQAVAAALPAPLTIQQQRLLADLLRLKRLVNRAAAKYDQMQLTSFLDAAANGDTDVVQDMLRQGMNPNSADYDGRTALMIAAYKGRKDVVLALLFAGADTSLKDARGFDVMIEGARGNRDDIIEVLRRSGARTGISIMLQASLLCKATYEGKLDRLTLLLKAGCDPDAHDYDGQTALHVAAAEGSLAAARVLIQAGASLSIKDRWGYNPLDVAHKVGAAPLVEFLAAQMPPDAAASSAEGWKRERTEAALAAARYGDTAALARLLGRGCPVDAADYDGRSLLHVAVHNKQEGIVKQLLEAGADPNIRGRGGGCPLLEAAMEGSTAIQSELMSAGARLGLPHTEEAALLSTVLHAHRHDQLLALLTAGADPAAADYDGRTPLHIAASLGDVGALQLMADALADSGIERLTSVNWQAKDRWGDTPLQEAQRAGHQEAADFLQQQIEEQQQRQQQQQQEAAALSSSLQQSSRTA